MLLLGEELLCGRCEDILPHLQWPDCVSLASVSKSLFHNVKVWVAVRSVDVSLGASPRPIPCEPWWTELQKRMLRRGSGSPPPLPLPRAWSIGGPLPPSFQYLNDAIFPFGVLDSAQDVLEGCSCCGEMCGVAGDDDGAAVYTGENEDQSSCPCARLNAAAKSGPAPLFECHAGCSCFIACPLRATQVGGSRTSPEMTLRFMGRKGWGAYSVAPIPKGTFVADYTGEVLPLEEARRRVPTYDRDGVNYVLTTQEFFQGGKEVWRTIVDATTSGNVSRFFNHSCEPTLSVYVVRRGSLLPRLAFFTLDHMPAGRELTYDYGATEAAGGGGGGGGRGVSRLDEGARERASSTAAATPLPPFVSVHEVIVARDRSQGGQSGSDLTSGETVGVRRRACLCGSRSCRGLLPYNRAIM